MQAALFYVRGMRSHVGRNTRFLHAFGMLTLCQSFKNTGGNLPDWWGFAVCFNPPICTGLPVLCTRFTHGVSFWQKGAGGKFPAGGLRLIKRNRPEPQRCMGRFFISGSGMSFTINVMPEEKYVLVNRSVYDAEADTDIVETMAVSADWLSHRLWWKETAPMNTLSAFLEEYTTEDVAAWYDMALLGGAVAFSFSMPGSALRFEWASDDGWKAEALLEVMDKFGFTPQQMLSYLRGKKEGAE